MPRTSNWLVMVDMVLVVKGHVVKMVLYVFLELHPDVLPDVMKNQREAPNTWCK